ncbi:hypothetical protein PV10_08330 [Exophiala mesophila]|uniref:KOW domain-containing protein n=1 Tax=Exophiala mesophila TaxID=212818 RepID=A0A0D1Z429_EXOME|nr:uncharacterized protein PV10_08330 [Exophiala mesophila]KIV88669.1 hypothetical protein PV10_08330 [Exophiala mesophila]
MQKILRINLNARNQGVRAARRNNLKKIKSEWFEYEQQFVQGQRTRTKAIKEERANRREDWIAGPLAPKRDVGRLKGLYGTIETAASRSPVVPRNARLGEDDTSKDPDDEEGEDPHEIPESKVIEGNARNILAGDRVCVIRGREGTKGRIGKVKEIFLDRNEISVEGINMADVKIPQTTAEAQTTPFTSVEVPLPIQDVRLVFRHTIVDDSTGRILKDRDVIVNHIRGGAPFLEREHGSNIPSHTRYIGGSDTEISWPQTDVQEFRTFDSDTRRREVEQVTHLPSIYDSPLPRSSVVDELISRYSNSRRWHEEEFVRMKIIEDARSRWYESRTLDTPHTEWKKHNMQKAAAKRQAQLAQMSSTVRPPPPQVSAEQ